MEERHINLIYMQKDCLLYIQLFKNTYSRCVRLLNFLNCCLDTIDGHVFHLLRAILLVKMLKKRARQRGLDKKLVNNYTSGILTLALWPWGSRRSSSASLIHSRAFSGDINSKDTLTQDCTNINERIST